MRRSLLVIVTIAVMAVCLVQAISCNKTNTNPPTPASFTVVNAMPVSNQIVPNFGGDTVYRYYKGAASGTSMTKISYGASQLYTLVPGSTSLAVVPITDTTFNIYKGKVTVSSGDIYSFFLSGDTAHADTMLIKDNIPVIIDSSTGVRFVNLSIGGKAIVINIVGDSGNLQFPAIGYQGVTDFKKYAATISAGTSYSFEIRDQASGALLKSYTWTFTKFRNSTIVIAGSPDPASPTPIRVFAVNNF